MPVRLLNSAVLKWPDRQKVINEARKWARMVGGNNKNIQQILCFGSICTGFWGVGSDLDVLIILNESDFPYSYRSSIYSEYLSIISIPVDILVYTTEEMDEMSKKRPRFLREIDESALDRKSVV